MKRPERKQDAVAAFVLEQLASDAGTHEVLDVMLVALSTKSPVVKGLEAIHQEMGRKPIRMRLILATLPENDPAEELRCFAPIEIRWAANPRFLDAHEQLVLGQSASWIGDCMRRDPEKRDAFHSFNSDCLEATAWARISFERLWQAARPLAMIEGPASDPLPVAEEPTSLPLPEHIVQERDDLERTRQNGR
jgi:hypothetical protein